MAQGGNGDQNLSVSVPIGVVAGGALLGLALAAFFLISKSDSDGDGPSHAAKSGKGVARKVGLMTLVTLIENDVTRKVVVALLKSIARRA